MISINILDIAYYGTLSSMFTYQVMSVANHNAADVLFNCLKNSINEPLAVS